MLRHRPLSRVADGIYFKFIQKRGGTGMSTDRGCHCGQAHGACTTEFQYAVKVVCGVANADTPGMPPTPVAPGRYWTAINIHNPDKCRSARFRWKVAIARRLGEDIEVPLYQSFRVLGPDQAVEIDCDVISQVLPPPAPGFIKGYVVLESDMELDVVAVYSGGQAGCAALSSIHTERVPARQVAVCEDLVLPLDTGLAAWQTVAPTTGSLGPVALVNPLNSAWTGALPFGARWVSQSSSDGTNASAGTRYYDLCFDLCSGFTVPAPFPIQVMAADSATIFLNNSVIGTAPAPAFQAPTTIPVDPSLLRAGRNCFRIEVNNVETATGFVVAGTLRVLRGKCPCSVLPLTAAPPDTTGPAANGLPGGNIAS
jgi:hypothetical protein